MSVYEYPVTAYIDTCIEVRKSYARNMHTHRQTHAKAVEGNLLIIPSSTTTKIITLL